MNVARNHSMSIFELPSGVLKRSIGVDETREYLRVGRNNSGLGTAFGNIDVIDDWCNGSTSLLDSGRGSSNLSSSTSNCLMV